MPPSRISQNAFSRKTAERLRRISVIKIPSTVGEKGERVIMPLAKIQAMPIRGMMPSTRERARIMGRMLVSPFLLLVVRRLSGFAVFTPELVTRAMDEDIFQRRLTHRN